MKAMVVKASALVTVCAALGGCTAMDSQENLDLAGAESGSVPLSDPCVGWENGGRTCMAECSDGGWYVAGHAPPLQWGQCQGKAVKKCNSMSLGLVRACWGH